jgi:uncharacterized protein
MWYNHDTRVWHKQPQLLTGDFFMSDENEAVREEEETPFPPGFHIMAKPTGPVCNLNCHYCFYLEKEKLYPRNPDWKMPEDVLEAYVRQFIASQQVPEVTFAWQGGEPTLLGIDFFRKAIAFQEKYADGKVIHNAFQSNGILLNDEWCAFLAENNFLIGLSIDGPQKFHDRYRVDKGGRPTFDKVYAAMQRMKRHGVEFNTLTCVQRHNSQYPLEVYRFLRDEGSGFLQFIPIIERIADAREEDGLTLLTPEAEEAKVTPWSVRPKDFGEFLCAVFDEWVRRDVGQTFVQIFDIALEAWIGRMPSLCVFRDVCGDGMALEHNGDLYSCDHYVYPENKLGNIMETSILEMAQSDFQRAFGRAKRDTLPQYCRDCEYHFMCHGECPKHRFLETPDGEPGLNYLCEGYKMFFSFIDKPMQFMAGELQQRRAPANIMRYIQQQEMEARGDTEPRPNDPCLCGSGKKYKKCCGRKA